MVDVQVAAYARIDEADQEQSEFATGWKLLLAASLGIGLGMAPLFMFTSGVFAIALGEEFGWTRSQILGAAIFDTLAVLTVGPIVGRFVDRIGARRIAILSVTGIGVGTILLSLITPQLWTYYALYALRSAVAVGTLPPTFAKVLNTHFDRKRGLALGIALCTTGVAGTILPIYVQTLIDAFGWRMAFIGLGLLPLIITLPAVFAFLPDTRRGTGTASSAPKVASGASVPEAIRNYRFWLMGGLTITAGIILGGILANLVPLLVDRGFTPADAARQAGVYGITIIFGRLASGYLLDRFWAPAVGCAFLLAPFVGALLLASGAGTVPIVTTGVILVALASGAEFDLIAFLTSRYFGLRNFSTIYAMQHACFGLGAGLGPAVFGAVRDQTGSYTMGLNIAAALFLLSAGLILLLGRYPQWNAETASA
jgi:MFS family permease